MSDVRQIGGNWVFLVPIRNLKLTETVNFEYRINKVTFISGDRLALRRKRLGFPKPLSSVRKKFERLKIKFFDDYSCFATLRRDGKLADTEDLVLKQIREELAILNASQLGYGKRNQFASPSISDENPRNFRRYFAVHSKEDASTQSNSTVENPSPLVLNAGWANNQKRNFFFDLIKIIRGEIKVERGWCKDLRNAAILVGQSQASRDLPQAFLWNVIALETLLTRQGDSYTTALPERAQAFLGWVGFWKLAGFEENIIDVYQKRSGFVHAGKRDGITLEHLFFTDDLLFNLFTNIIKHHRIFKSKDAVIEFSKKVQAEHLLGINAKVRPKTLRYTSRSHSNKEFRG